MKVQLTSCKLGYGGTQSEMKRLIAHANEIRKAQGITTKLTIDSFADIVTAIHTVQDEMHIVGTTEAEALGTISGSMNAMRAAWTNLLIGISDDSQNLDTLVNNFAESAVTAVSNIAKRIPSIVKGVNQLIRGLAPKLPGMVQDLLPSVVEGAIGLISGLALALPEIFNIIVEMLPDIVNQIFTAFEEVFPALMESMSKLFENLFNFIFGDLLGTSITFQSVVDKAVSALNAVTEWCSQNSELIENIVIIIGSFAAAWVLVNGAITIWNAISAIATAVTAGFGAAFALLTSPITIVIAAIGAVVAIVALCIKYWEEIKTAAVNVWNGIVATWNSASEWFSTNVVEPIKTFFTNLWHEIQLKALTAIGGVRRTWYTISTWFDENVIQPISEFFTTLKGNIEQAFSDAKENVKTAWNTITTWFNDNVVQPLKEKWAEVKEALAPISTSVTVVIDIVKKIFGVSEAGGDLYNEDGSFAEGVNYDPETGMVQMFDGSWYNPSNASDVDRVNASGAIFSKATIFDTRLGRQMVGEAGPEAVAPISVLRQYVREEVEAANKKDNGMVEAFENFTNNLPDMLVSAFASMKFDVNNREFARLVKAVN